MNKFKAQLTALGTATTLAITSLAVDVKPAQADGGEFWGGVVGGLVGSILGNGNSQGSNRVSSSDIKKALKKVMISHGLTPREECHANSVSVTLATEELCAIPNHRYSPGTYTVSETKQLIPYGISANQDNGGPINRDGGHLGNGGPINRGGGYSGNGGPINRGGGYSGNGGPINRGGGYSSNGGPINRGGGYSGGGYPGDSFNQGPILSLNGQPISPQVKARLRAILSSKNIAEANCGATLNQVVLTVNNQYMVCGHPNRQYSPGNYNVNTGTFY